MWSRSSIRRLWAESPVQQQNQTDRWNNSLRCLRRTDSFPWTPVIIKRQNTGGETLVFRSHFGRTCRFVLEWSDPVQTETLQKTITPSHHVQQKHEPSYSGQSEAPWPWRTTPRLSGETWKRDCFSRFSGRDEKILIWIISVSIDKWLWGAMKADNRIN